MSISMCMVKVDFLECNIIRGEMFEVGVGKVLVGLEGAS